ncbi:hypothetical protein [Legionella drancourtii]|uniref:Substrate of the Dot/Icm secretion system n=1 Tax=Legionella drancourtii LLAP12 TaxID=658187 RepID=G9EPN1_9GAMM|nr:hypothetical protein [Legionella drancourtii]EHL30769.1 hypothetical protein LDG_7197 [Legionella drancourtii LLAP12]
MAKASRFPSTTEIKSAMEMAGSSIEGTEYLVSRIKKLAENSKLLSKSPELKANVIAAIEQFAEYVKFKLTTHGQPWSGQRIETSDLKNMQKNIAESAAKELTGKLSEVKLDYAVSEKGHYVRGYSSNNGALDSKSVESLDKLFNAWLASKDYVIKGGYLYSANDSVQGENMRISADVVKKLMAEGGLQEFMAEKGFNTSMKARDYPGEQKEAQAQQEVEYAVEQANRVSEERAPDVVPEEAPNAGVGRH